MSEEARLLGLLRDMAGSYIEPCSGCDAPTWWRTDARVPLCLRCTVKTGRQAVNAVPPKLREFLPPYPPAHLADPAGGSPLDKPTGEDEG